MMHKADQVCQSIDAHILRYICSSFLLSVTGGLVMPSQHTRVQPWGMLSLLTRFPIFLKVTAVLHRALMAGLRLFTNDLSLELAVSTSEF